MVVLNIETSGCQPQTIVIGRRGTYETTQIAFGLAYLVEAYGSGVAVLAVKRSQDESAYPAVVTQENNTLTWTVSETDTAYVGAGECQLMWYVEGGLAKTIIYPMVVMRDILSTAEEPPDGYENWIEHLTGLGAETQQNAQNAAQSATEAKASAEAAAESEKKAEDAADFLENVSATATTLEPGQEATAEYDEGVFKFGIPKGDKLTYADLTEADKEDLVQGPIKAAQNDAIEAVGTAKTNAVDAVNQAGTTNKNAVTQEGTTQVNAVREAGTTQVGRVTSEGNTQVNRVQAKGDEVLDSIPQDYSDLVDDVADLTRQISDVEDAVSGSNNTIVKGGVALPSTFVFGTLDSSGAIAPQSANRRCTTVEYITLSTDNVIKVESGYAIILCIYNSDFTLSSRTIYNGPTNVNIAANSIFRVCILVNGSEPAITSPYEYISNAYLILPYVNTLSSSITALESSTSQNTADISNLAQNVAAIFENEITFVDVENAIHTDGGFVRTSGNLDPVSGYSYYTVPCQSGDVFDVTSFAGSAARLWLVKSANNTVLSYSTDSSAPSLKHEEVTIPTNGATLIVNTGNGSATIKKAEVDSIIKDELLPSPKNNRLYGKVYCAVGDSITYGDDIDADGITQTSQIEVHQWSGVNSVWNDVTSNFRHTYAYQIAERNNMVFWNGGVSGSTMQGIEERRGFSLENGRYTLLPDHIDYLTIFFGWNDAVYGTLGAISDTTNQSYYGGYNVVLPYLINKYPYAKIALVVPFGTDEGHRNAIRQLGNKWGVAVWDNYQGGTPLYYGKEDSVGVEASIVTSNRAKFQANGAHPNYKGHTQLADMIENFLRSI